MFHAIPFVIIAIIKRNNCREWDKVILDESSIVGCEKEIWATLILIYSLKHSNKDVKMIFQITSLLVCHFNKQSLNV